MDIVRSSAAEKQPVVCKSTCEGEATDSSKEKTKPALYFPDGSILKALLMSPLSFKQRIRNGIYQNGAYSTFPPESKITVETEPLSQDDRSNSISPTVLRRKFYESRRPEGGGGGTVASMRRVNSFINKFGSELVSSSGTDDVKEEPDTDEGGGGYSDDSNECIPSLNVEVELEEGEGIINSHNIDYFYSGTNFGKDLHNGEIHENNKQDLMNGTDKLGMALEDLRCEVCGRQFNFKKNMNKHLRHMHGLGRFRCAVCPLEFEKRRDLIHHRDSHSESGVAGGGFKCEICGKIIQWYNHFIQHRRTHEPGTVTLGDERRKRHVCSVCSKGFRSAANLRVHLRTHTGERPFVCNICGVSFAQKRIQVDHMNKHTGARPYECQECGDKFSNYITYNVHKRTRHSTPERPNTFACSLCDVSFIWRSNLASHMRSHARDRAFRCPVCDKTFAHRKGLAYHRRSHECYRTKADVKPRNLAEREHACVECGRTFVAKSTLVRHVRMQHGTAQQQQN